MLIRYIVMMSIVLTTQHAAATESEGSPTVDSLYQHNCFTCHGTGLPGAPQKNESAEWQRRALQGTAVLYEHALEGFIGDSGMLMPPKGGNPELTDEQVRLLVDYMLKEP